MQTHEESLGKVTPRQPYSLAYHREEICLRRTKYFLKEKWQIVFETVSNFANDRKGIISLLVALRLCHQDLLQSEKILL